ncbi:MAG: amidohydrolase family protein, partial [Coxiellaceae bacterium]|nr:amidohydrolase family protein [Coxiellaceae bacterium]
MEIIQPDDWHCHLRDGDYLARTVTDEATQFGRAIVMPNLKNPVKTVADASAYRDRILKAIPAGQDFQPLMTLYLTDETTPQIIEAAAKSDIVFGCKLYPAGATTNSSAGVADLTQLYPVFAAMEKTGLPLL